MKCGLASRHCFLFRRNLKKVESDGTAGGVLGEECRAVLRFVFGASGGLLMKKVRILVSKIAVHIVVFL
jgi:hypothetical protein